VIGSPIYVVSVARRFDGRVVRATDVRLYRVDWFDHKIHRTFDDRTLDATTHAVSGRNSSRGRRRALGFCLVSAVQRWVHEGVQRVQNVSRCAWVKTDAASVCVSTDVAFTVFFGSVGFYPRAARYILYPLYPPQVSTSGVASFLRFHLTLLYTFSDRLLSF
jgi:hypothetical protein